jgi:hypothetical protein
MAMLVPGTCRHPVILRHSPLAAGEFWVAVDSVIRPLLEATQLHHQSESGNEQNGSQPADYRFALHFIP